MIRGAGYLEEGTLKDSSMRMKLLIKEKIGLYASPVYLQKHAEPKVVDELSNHVIINYVAAKKLIDQEKWKYSYKNKVSSILLMPKFNCNDIESALTACISGYGIGKFTDLNVKQALQKQQLLPILQQYNWGQYNLYASIHSNKLCPSGLDYY